MITAFKTAVIVFVVAMIYIAYKIWIDRNIPPGGGLT